MINNLPPLVDLGTKPDIKLALVNRSFNRITIFTAHLNIIFLEKEKLDYADHDTLG